MCHSAQIVLFRAKGGGILERMRKIRAAIFGAGFMARVHTEGVRRLGNVEVAGLAARTLERARSLAAELSIERATGVERDGAAQERLRGDQPAISRLRDRLSQTP